MATTTKNDSALQTTVALVQLGDGKNVILPWDGESKDATSIQGFDQVVNHTEIIFGFLLSDLMSQEDIEAHLDRMDKDVDLQAWMVEVGETPIFGPDDSTDADCNAAEASWQTALDEYVKAQKEADEAAKVQKKAKQSRAAGARKAKATKPKKSKPALPAGVDQAVVDDLMAADTTAAENKILKAATGQTIAPIKKTVQDWLDGDKDSFQTDADFRKDITSFLKTTQKAIKNGDLKASELDASALYGLWVIITNKEGGAPLRAKKKTQKRLTKK